MNRIIIFILLLSMAMVSFGQNNNDREKLLRHLSAINTMVGTDMANTHSVGIYGKGSEEHGQTLPAVLVPNGQNFWTPQTQDTEQKCIAPYYYKDTTLQGFRNSHWIVGGCTQDYGSFTVSVLSNDLRLQPAERATRFSHDEEESHPYYYGVRLPDEHLKVEITGLSHSADMRVTTEKDELIHVIINPNSDENEGYIEIDTISHQIYGYNPVHRIYQGWGEPAGFSGHFVFDYDIEFDLVEWGLFSDEGKTKATSLHKKPHLGAWLTFRAKANTPVEFYMGTSFTSKESAIDNVETEMGNLDFDDAEKECINEWITRFSTIVVDDPDEARVNQFYGAFYRASFLPREMSDCNGTYPSFANSNHLPIRGEDGRGPFYGDFSMWDIYRAQLPLYCIIAPSMVSDMMQSLVTMYEEGGWLPIFPCWNSYTAAMIGDHCSVALADAYIKGIRGFDYEKAYEGMRKNAFESPATFEEYKNGMGRRALESYLKYGYIPLEDEVKEAFHNNEQTSRTLEYAFDDFAVAQMAKALGRKADYKELMRRSRNWRNVINPRTGFADGRHADGSWANNTDNVSRVPFITEGATCHYSWYVPHDIKGLRQLLGKKNFEQRLDSLFDLGRYWHGNEPCHQIAYLYNYTSSPWKTHQRVARILDTEYNDTPGGLSGNDDAGQMSAWYIFSAMGFYPVCPATPFYETTTPLFNRITLNLEDGKTFVITKDKKLPLRLKHSDITGHK